MSEGLWAIQRIQEYQQSMEQVREQRKDHERRVKRAEEQRDFETLMAEEEHVKYCKWMEANCRYAIRQLAKYATAYEVDRTIQKESAKWVYTVTRFDPVILDNIGGTFDDYDFLRDEVQAESTEYHLDLRVLSYREREALLLYVLDGCTWSEIAQQLDVTRSSVQTYIRRARQKLQRLRVEGVQLTLINSPASPESETTYVHGLTRDKPPRLVATP
ncbi:sigma factor-like helix-turn-helix DNA-binding protein [Alicyclobacillus sp. SO9]|uniref:sigma factor-like helix-turn-helix DNA-binding protein n=1 Tax=Alicyclobacillus sp. SO9 TaxID=2665646 RepID=UPI0018E8A5BC|nr:sigma factor-like helix-turn-helix DNA-binding protein [Alicyclobacillus sp. SO9]QQE79506.1 hypothetical protein GI364_03145 [Alicyclobacillus sp. SO9]